MTNVANGGFITDIECTVCLEVPEEDTRILQCNNGHIFCQICYLKLSKCPACRLRLATEEENGLGPIRCLIAENLVRKISKRKVENDVPEKIYINGEGINLRSEKMNIDGESITLRPERIYTNKRVYMSKSFRPISDNVRPILKNELRIEVETEQPLTTPRNDSYQQKYFGVYWGRRLPKDI